MNPGETPPAWAEKLLRIVLKPRDIDGVTGDLLEQYRDSIHPIRSQRRADLWYVTQVMGFVWRATRVWGCLLGAGMIGRYALDWRFPPSDFHLRSAATTYFAIGLLVTAGFWAAWRSGSWVAGTVAGLATTSVGAAGALIGGTALLTIWHDPQTMTAIGASGGLAEAFTLPLLMIVPGMLLGTIGGATGATVERIARRKPKA
jgi:hypothetical protein